MSRSFSRRAARALVSTTLCAALGAALCQCSPQPAPAPPEAAKAPDFGYDVALTFTPAAREKIGKSGDKVSLEALYYGNPTTQTAALADANDGTIHLDTDTLETDASDHSVHMDGKGVTSSKNFPYIVEHKPLVLLTVHATHDGKRTQLIGCGGFQDYVSVAQTRPIPIRCDLL